ncbi:helix-turn-helix domain-containing protein [Noviherbaspirillum galbum]|uniref:Helix-turn-helix domain-containing protein n=1 Tax=Noviherbaspirillum galbum TaxID=2709383 RepID=A0A6B3SQ29_9BURK|nr:helix-turn-helix domain-containing protein [Noviherbaspirillum galbum]NEX62618.1 helix-turn-helix domain-containing protein [Noviherbaspirillum galbum]
MNHEPDEARGQDMSSMPSSPGAILRRGREERGWTVEQVASQLNLAPRQVHALESDDYPSLPGMAIVRGFTRSYAKLLRIDAAPLLAALGGETMMAKESLPSRKPLATPFSETRMPSMTDKNGVSSKWLIGGLLVVLAGVGLWAAQQNGQVASLSKSASEQVRDGIAQLSGSDASKNASAPQSAPATNSAESATSATAPSAPPAPATSNTPSPDAGAPPAAPSAPAADAAATAKAPAADKAQEKPAEPPKAAAPANAAPDSAASSGKSVDAGAGTAAASDAKNPLVLNVREESWVTVKRAGDGGTVFSRLMKAGTSETIDIPGPVNVVIGNAAGASATLRGAPVDLKPGSSNVAKLSLK